MKMLVSDHFREVVSIKPLKYQTLVNIERCLKRLDLWDMDIATITPTICFRRLEGLTNQNVKRTYSGYVRNVFDYTLKQIPIVQGISRTYDLPTQEELHLVIDRSKYKFQLYLCMYAGLRIGEACAVIPKQVKKEGNNYFLVVDRAISQDGKNISSPKTFGRVLIPEWLALDILNMKPEDYWQKGVPTKRVTSACFSLSTHGKKVHINPHMLRHWFATDMARRNVPPNVMMKQMRHANVNTCMAIYSQVNNADLVNSVPVRYPALKAVV
jgi:integrase